MPTPMISGRATAAGRSTATRPRRRSPAPSAVPGDKSISHRALMLGALAVGRTEIAGLLEGEDVLATAAALRAMGAGDRARERTAAGASTGSASAGSREPDDVLDLGNSGTAARLLLGILATHPLTAFVTGDASLRRRPMGRVDRPAVALRGAFRHARGRPAAARGDRRRRPGADQLSSAGAVGAGQIGGAARRAQHARRQPR